MRILFSTVRATSHLRALVPVALAARERGHSVAVAGAPSMGAEVTDEYGLDFVPAGGDWTTDAVTTEAIGRQLAFGAHDDYTGTLVDRVFLGPPALRMARDILALDRSPDLVVRVAEEFGGYLAAEVLGIPHAAVASGCTHLLGVDRVGARVAAARTALGLPAEPADPYRYLLASFAPPSYLDGVLDDGKPRYYRQPEVHRVGESPPPWMSTVDGDRSLVYAAFGSVLPGLGWKLRPVLSAVVDALGDLDRPVVVSVGAAAGELSRVPAGVRLVDRVPQPRLLRRCALFVTHCGFASVREALCAGTPMVCLPVIGDEPYHAARCAALGVGRTVPGAVTARSVADAVADVLGTARYAERARAVRAEIESLPTVETLVADLEALG
jgi:N-glycosyltransferase